MCFILQESNWVPTEYYEGVDLWVKIKNKPEFG